MLASVRNRRGVVAAVEPFDVESGRLHLVQIEYKDRRSPSEERLLWELEPGAALDEPNALPDPASPPMLLEDFDALLRAGVQVEHPERFVRGRPKLSTLPEAVFINPPKNGASLTIAQ